MAPRQVPIRPDLGRKLRARPNLENDVKRIMMALAIVASSSAAARKPCAELQSEIDAKIKANGVAAYSLTVVAADAVDASAGKVVGSCDGGEKRIVYLRMPAPLASAVAASGK